MQGGVEIERLTCEDERTGYSIMEEKGVRNHTREGKGERGKEREEEGKQGGRGTGIRTGGSTR